MLLTIYLALVFCMGITVLLISAVAFVQEKKFFSSAPKEAQEVVQPRNEELFYGARKMGWFLFILSILILSGVFIISIWDGFRNQFSFWQFFLRFIIILSVYKLYDMIFFDWFLLCKYHFFQFYYPEVTEVYHNRKYGYNLKSQLLKLFVLFPLISALLAWICTLF